MKIDKKLIKELVENLKEFNLTELEYQEGQSKIKLASQDLRKRWKMKQEKLSPNYTCKIDQIIKVK